MMTITNRATALFLLCAACFFHAVVASWGQESVQGELERIVQTTVALIIQSGENDALSSDEQAVLNANVAQLRTSKANALGALLRYSPKGSYPPGQVKRATVLLRKKLEISFEDVLEYVLAALNKESCDRDRLYALMASVPDPSGEWLDARFAPEFLQSQIDNLHAPFVQQVYSVYPQRGVIHLIENCIRDEKRRADLLRAARNAVVHTQMNALLQGKAIDNKTVQSVLSDLNILVESEEWWIRYFVARFLHYGPMYRDKQLLATLKADDHQLVREVVRNAKSSN